MIRSSWFAGDEAGSECSMLIMGLGKPITGAETVKAMTSLADAALVVWPGKRLFLYRPRGSLGFGSRARVWIPQMFSKLSRCGLQSCETQPI